MAARKNKIRHDQNTIERIRETVKATQLVNALSEHVLSGKEMAATQVTAALGLLKKVIPDLSAQQLTGADGGAIKVEHSNALAVLESRIAGIASRIKPEGSVAKPNGRTTH